MPVLAPGPFISPGVPFAPRGPVDHSTESNVHTCDIIEIAHSTVTATQVNVTFTNTGVTVSGGTLDRWIDGLLPGDLVVAVIEDTATGGTATFTPGSFISSNTIEGATAGAFSASAYNGTGSNPDFNFNVNPGGGTKIITVWSTLIGDFVASKFAGAVTAPQLGVVCTTAGTTGTRRSQVYVVRPRIGYSIPVRGRRLVAQGTESGTQSAIVTVNVPMTWTYSKVRDGGVAMLVVAFADSGASGVSVDADNDTTLELVNNDYTMSGSETTVSKGYQPGAANRPGTQVNVRYLANPGANGHATAVLCYSLEPDTFPQANRSRGAAMAGNAVIGGGPLKFPGSRHGWVALSGKAQPRSKYAIPATRNSGVALSGYANPKYVKRASAQAGMAIDGIAAPFKPSTYHRSELLVPPGKFAAPSQNIFGIQPLSVPLVVFVADGDTATGTDTGTVTIPISDAETATSADAVVRVALTGTSDTGTATDAASIALTSTDTGTATDAASIALALTDTGTATDAASVVVAITSADSGIATDAGTTGGNVPVASSDTATATDTVVLIAITSAEAATATDAVLRVATTSAEIAAAADAASVVVAITSADSGIATEAGSAVVLHILWSFGDPVTRWPFGPLEARWTFPDPVARWSFGQPR